LLVVDAINLATGGARAILEAFLEALAAEIGAPWRAIAYVRDETRLPAADRIAYVRPRLARNSWLARGWFDAFGLRRSLGGRPVDTFLSLQGSGARVDAARKFVYCHNALPLEPLPLSLAIAQPRLAMMRKIYDRLYRSTIGPETVAIVQQSWVRDAMAARYGLRDIIVAHPVGTASAPSLPRAARRREELLRIVYPTFPYPHKNMELLCDAARILSQRAALDFRLVLTVDGSENRYARRLRALYGDVPQIHFAGLQAKEDMRRLYEDSDLLVFPSRIEAWGLPIAEAKDFGLGILAADLPYARETVGDYDQADFFDPDDPAALAQRIDDCWSDRRPLRAVAWPAPGEPYARDWRTLVAFILDEIPWRPDSSLSEPMRG
jgi:glycosyltransferase involved in cell wall biosynthesis